MPIHFLKGILLIYFLFKMFTYILPLEQKILNSQEGTLPIYKRPFLENSIALHFLTYIIEIIIFYLPTSIKMAF